MCRPVSYTHLDVYKRQGKGRVCKIFETEIDAGTRAKHIKAEYGQGGAGWPVDGLGPVSYTHLDVYKRQV